MLENLPVKEGKVEVDESDFVHLTTSDLREACMATGCDSYGMNRDATTARFVKWIRELKPASVDIDALPPGGAVDHLLMVNTQSGQVAVPAAEGYLTQGNRRRRTLPASSSHQ